MRLLRRFAPRNDSEFGARSGVGSIHRFALRAQGQFENHSCFCYAFWMHSIFFFLLASFHLAQFAISATPTELKGIDLRTGEMAQAPLDTPAPQLGTAFVFLSVVCPCSTSHEKTLQSLAKEFPQIRFVGIHSNPEESVTEARAHFSESELPFPVLQDDSATLADAWGALKTPHVFVKRAGSTEWYYRGAVDNSHDPKTAKTHYLKDALSAMVQGNQPEKSEVKPIGCSIR